MSQPTATGATVLLHLTRRKPYIYGFHGFWCVSSEAPTRSIRAYPTWGEALASVNIPLPEGWTR